MAGHTGNSAGPGRPGTKPIPAGAFRKRSALPRPEAAGFQGRGYGLITNQATRVSFVAALVNTIVKLSLVGFFWT